MSHAAKARREKRNASTQTSDMSTVLEIARLQEQVKLLTIENEHLRKYTVPSFSTVLKTTSPITSPIDVSETPKRTESKQRQSSVKSTQKKNTKAPIRGCTCKGNCSSKICGCVKRDTQCGESCKCKEAVCQNQEQKDTEQNKENLENTELASRRAKSKEVANKQLVNVIAHKSIFSPDVTVHNSTSTAEQCRPPSLYFGSPKQLTFKSNDEDEEEDNDREIKEKSVKNDKNDENGVTKRRGRPKKSKLEVSNKYMQKFTSTSNEKKQKQSDMAIEKQALGRCNSSEIATQTIEEVKEIEKRSNNYLQNITQGMASLRRGLKGAKLNSAKEMRSKNDTESSANSSTETSASSVTDEAKEMSPNATIDLPKSLDEGLIDSHEMRNHDTSGSCDMNEDDFNPMKPKHELPRTPTHGNSDTSSHSSDTSLPISIITTRVEEEELPVPEEFSQPEVDWEQYQSQLVACNKCKRKFHPFRIKKHQFCCKNV